jgi:hypothetical protein
MTNQSRVAYRKFFSSLGFDDNPFASTNADEEERLGDYFVPPPYFSSVFGNPDNPKSFVVFAPRGGGKSAQRRMLEDKCKEQQVLAVTYDQFEFPEIQDIKDITLHMHLKRVIRFIIMGILVSLHGNPELKDRLDKHDREIIVKLATQYLTGVTEYTLKKTLDSLKSLKDKAQDFYNEWLPTINIGVGALLQRLVGVDVDMGAFEVNAPTESPYLKYQLSLIVSVAHRIGFRSVYILIDRVDEAELTGNDVKASFSLIEPMLKDLELLELEGVAFKFFLWDQLHEPFRDIARTDRIKQETLVWNDSMLMSMWNKRLSAYSLQQRRHLAEIAEEAHPHSVDELALIFANHSPRDMIRIGDQIFSEQQELGLALDDPKITANAIYTGVDKFCARRATEILSPKALQDFRKVRRVAFTIPYLANEIFREKQTSTRGRISRWRGEGAIVDVERVDNPDPQRNRSVKLMAVADIRVAKTIYPDLSIPDFLEQKYRRCPDCETVVLRDWETETASTRCHACQRDLASESSDVPTWQRKFSAAQFHGAQSQDPTWYLQDTLFDVDETENDE